MSHGLIEIAGTTADMIVQTYGNIAMDTSSIERKYIFGPVPSRRLGRSLGVDLVPYKICTFDCIYCDLGRTTQKTTLRQSLVPPEDIRKELGAALSVLDKKPDFITLSGSGEPTLQKNIGDIIRTVKETTSIPVTVLTNSSLLSRKEVRNALLQSDLVLPSLDAITPALFGYINRPHPSLKIEEIISGLIQFRKQYRGQIWLEILFCRGVNDGKEEIEKFKETIARIRPDKIQLNTVARPPCEDFVFPLNDEMLQEIRAIMGETAEVISEFTAPLGDRLNADKEDEILNLIRRRPCTADDVSKALGLHLEKAMKHLSQLNLRGRIRHRMFQHHCYYEYRPGESD